MEGETAADAGADAPAGAADVTGNGIAASWPACVWAAGGERQRPSAQLKASAKTAPKPSAAHAVGPGARPLELVALGAATVAMCPSVLATLADSDCGGGAPEASVGAMGGTADRGPGLETDAAADTRLAGSRS